ncbi:MAG: biotin/lipoate A/B protein ligase family protein [Candidatus Korarchaeota archaeon]|nr:biotin/lipoate A/B protein ligase family protein [Candidatus Korarchaeota archaeon]
MRDSIRTIVLRNPIDVAWGLALEEAVLRLLGEGKSEATVIAWRAHPAVVIGVNPETLKEVDLQAVEELGIRLVRRESGGGAVYLDPGCLIYSVIVPRRSTPEEAKDRYRTLSAGVADLLRDMGLEPEFRDLGVWIRGFKVSGTAQSMSYGGLLHHGTLLVSTNLEALNAVIVRPKAPVANVSDLMNREVDPAELLSSLVNRVALSLGLRPRQGEFTPEEVRLAESLLPKYCRRDLGPLEVYWGTSSDGSVGVHLLVGREGPIGAIVHSGGRVEWLDYPQAREAGGAVAEAIERAFTSDPRSGRVRPI